MKILHVTNFFKPSWDTGGIARSAYELSRELASRGHEVTVYTTDGKNRLDVKKDRPVDVDGIETYYFKNASTTLAKANMPLPLAVSPVARREVRDFDIIHLHGFRTIPSAVVQHYAKKYKVPYVVQPRGTAPRSIKPLEKKLFDSIIGDRIIYGAERLIASSTFESGQFKGLFPQIDSRRIVHLPNGVEADAYGNLPEKGRFRRRFGINQHTGLILYVGRIHQRKGLDVLVRSFSKVQKKATLAIVGPDDGYLGELKKLVISSGVDDKVVLTGPLYGREKYEAYVDSDLFVLPSKDTYESFGNVAIEALRCGTPVILTTNCGVAEWLNDKVGRIVNCNELELWEAIEQVLDDRSLKESCKLEGMRLISTEFNWKPIVDRLEGIYSQILDGRSIKTRTIQ